MSQEDKVAIINCVDDEVALEEVDISEEPTDNTKSSSPDNTTIKLSSSPSFSETHSLNTKEKVLTNEIEENDEIAKGKSGIPGATMNFVNSIVGAGIVGIPFGLYRSGFFVGIMLLFFVSYLVDYGVILLIKCGKKTGTSTYEDLCKHVYGTRGYYAVSFFMFLVAYGSMVVYIIIIGDTVPKIAAQADIEFLENRQVVIMLFSAFFMLPLALLRDMSSLAWSSSLSVVADIILILLVMESASSAAASQGISYDTEETPLAFIRHTVFAGIGSMSFAFTCHHSSFFVHSSMRNPTLSRWAIVTHSSITFSFIACASLGLSGYLNFYSKVKSDILNNFANDDNVINMARALLASTMVFTYPMENYVARHAINSLIVKKEGGASNRSSASLSSIKHIGITLALWSSSTIIGLCFEDVGFVLELTGAIGASTLGYILPGHLYFSIRDHEWTEVQGYWRKDSPTFEKSFKKRLRKSKEFIWPCIMFVFGLLALVIGTVSAFLE